MENQHEEREGVLGGIAVLLNAGGSAAIYAYDITFGAFGRLFSIIKKAPVVPEKAFDMVVGGFGIIKPGDIKSIEDKISGYEKKIKVLYYQIGEKGASYSGDESALETEPVKKLMAEVRECEKEIQRLETRIVEVKEQKKTDALQRKRLKRAVPKAKKQDKMQEEKVKKSVESAITKAARQGEFETRSEMEIFDKVANDLIDNEMEIKILAAAELGKIGNDAAVPILMEAANFDKPDLISEIINSLITLGDVQAIPLFKEKATDPKHRVRIGCLRGLYKLAEDEEAIPVLTGALRDAHPEVRRTAATFIGWKDYADAVPGLVQCLRDEDAGVRKAAVSAVANIKDDSSVLPLIKVLGDKEMEIREKAFEAIKVISGEEITFDINASGKELKDAIKNLRDWWQKERLGKIDITEVEEPDTEMEASAVEEAERLAAEVEAEEAIEEPEAEAGSTDGSEFTEEKMKRMLKADLLAICEERSIECNEDMTKAELIERILGE